MSFTEIIVRRHIEKDITDEDLTQTILNEEVEKGNINNSTEYSETKSYIVMILNKYCSKRSKVKYEV